jgi:hypothetical protein
MSATLCHMKQSEEVWCVSSANRIFLIVSIGSVAIFFISLVTSAFLIGSPNRQLVEHKVDEHAEPPMAREEPNPEELATDRVLNRLASQLAFDPPRELQMGETKTITLLLSQKKTTSDLAQELKERGGGGRRHQIITAENIPTTERMEARLTGKDFQIEALDSEEQAITSDSSTIWRWDVTPTEWGKKRLHLTVAAVLEVQGDSATHTVTTYDKDITVTVRISQRLMSYASSIPSAITSGVILGILGVIGAAFLGWWKGWWSRLLQRTRSGQD